MSYDKGYLRIGKLSSIDYPNGKASVTYEDLNDKDLVPFFRHPILPRQERKKELKNLVKLLMYREV